MGVMCYAQDNSIELPLYRPARKCLSPDLTPFYNFRNFSE